MNKELNEAAEEWHYEYKFLKDLTQRINKQQSENLSMEEVEAVLDAIDYNKFQAEQKVPTDEAIEKLAEKFYPDTSIEKYVYNGSHQLVSSRWATINAEILRDRRCFVEGFKSALQYSVPDKYWEGFDFALAMLDEMYSKSYTHPYNVADCIKAKVNRLDKDKIRATPLQYSVGDGFSEDDMKESFDAGYDFRSSLTSEIVCEYGENSMPDFNTWLTTYKQNQIKWKK